MNSIDTQYQALLYHIKLTGTRKETRNGPVISTFGRQIRHNMAEGFPLLTTKKMYWKGIVAELLWFLRGDTNIKFLLDNDCHIWDGDAYKNYLNKYKGNFEMDKEEFVNAIKTNPEFANEYGELGPIYGKQWRSWGRRNVTNYDLKDVKGSDQPKVLEAIKNGEDVTKYGVKIQYHNNSIDQIANLINDLKTNPDSRRLMVSAWNVGELDQMVLPPCHYGFQCYVRDGKYLSLMWSQRSVDTFLGLPFNIASYGLLLSILAELTGMIPDQLIGSLGDVHLYENHIDQAQEQLKRTPLALPKLRINTEFWNPENSLGKNNWVGIIEGMQLDDFQIEGYESHPVIKAPLSN